MGYFDEVSVDELKDEIDSLSKDEFVELGESADFFTDTSHSGSRHEIELNTKMTFSSKSESGEFDTYLDPGDLLNEAA